MAHCSFATQDPLIHDGVALPSGTYVDGPFRIVHHTTEGGNYSGARATYLVTKAYPHFTVTDTTIYQHLDTSKAATALRHPSGTVQTNNLSAIQMEVVGFASHAKSIGTLRNIARLCRWIEQTHDVPRVWPNGFPTPQGTPHNRNASTWLNHGGHYGHCHVPNNTHEDPGYTAAEIDIIMGRNLVEVFVGGTAVEPAQAYLDGDRLWGAIRPIIVAMGGTVTASDDQLTVSSVFRGQTVVSPARGISAGKAFIALGDLRKFNGVQVTFAEGDPDQATIDLP